MRRVLITAQYDRGGRQLLREHAKDTLRDGVYLRFSDVLEIQPNACRLELELWIKGKGASGEWYLPTLTPTDAPAPRVVRVAPVHLKWSAELGATKESRFDAFLRVLDTLGERGVDLVVFGEDAYGGGLGLNHEERCATLEREIHAALGKKAKEYTTYIVYCGLESADDRYYNTAFLYGRDGELVGKYRKTHLPVTELDDGIAPGEELPVFDTDFGRIALLVCFDQFFPECAKALASKGTELICIPTVGDDHIASLALAMYTGTYLAVAGVNTENDFGWKPTRVVDPLGRILSQTDICCDFAYCEIDLSKKVRRHWMSTGPGLSSVHDDYRYQINPHCFSKNDPSRPECK